MTPEQLAVERDALLAGGRTLEEAERMQRAEAWRDALQDALALLSHADFSNGVTSEFGGIDEGEVLAGRMIHRLRALLSPDESAGGAPEPRPGSEPP